MSGYPRLRLLVLIGSTLATLSPAVAAPAAVAPTPEQQEARLAKRIAGDLEAGHVTEARADAEAAVQRFPASALLHRRLAQAHFSLALQRDGELQQALDDARLAQSLTNAVSLMHNSGDPPVDNVTPEMREQFSRFLLFISGPEVTQFQERALKELQESSSLLQQRSQALTDAFADMKEARRLGDAGTELELTDLWSQTVVLFWRQQPDKLKGLGKGRLAGIDQALAPFTSIQPDLLLRASAKLARQQPADPAALAGAADLVSVIAGITKKPDPLRDHLHGLLDHVYLENIAAFEPQVTKAARETHRQLYVQMRDAKEPDVVNWPAAVALQLYSQALERDAGYTLPYLRLRLYLLRIAFEPEAARPLLEEIRRREPGNMAPVLEDARKALVLENQPLEGLRDLQLAAPYTQFSRSYLVAVPVVLPPALKFQRELREWIGKAWPGYGGLFGTLDQMQHFVGAPGLTRAQQQLYRSLEGQIDLPGLEARLADPFCRAVDYADQSQGLGRKSFALGELVDRAKKSGSPPELQAALKQQLEAQRRAAAEFPHSSDTLFLGLDGMVSNGAPDFEQRFGRNHGPYLVVSGSGGSWFSFH